MPLTSGSRARISLMRFASVSHCSTVIALLPTRITSSTSSRATFFSCGIASATSPAWRRPDGVLAMVPPVATTFTSGSLSCECARLMPSASVRIKSVRRESLPGAVIDGVLVGGAGHRHVPLDRPVVGVVEPLARVGLRRGVQQAPGLELLGLQEAAGLADEIVDERRRVFLDELDRPRLRAEHLLERRAVEVVAGRLAAGRVRLDQNAQTPFLGHADPGLH